MAKLVPPLEIIDKFVPSLESGERALMEALCYTLDDTWTIYVQPFLNGLQPDIVIFSDQTGLAIFEVKDWNLKNYQIDENGVWKVYDGRNQRWHESPKRCPILQVQKYKDDIMRYELPELEAEAVLNKDIYGIVIPFVYFHKHTTQEINQRIGALQKKHEHVTVFGNEFLEPSKLKSLLSSRRLQKESLFAQMMQQYQLQN